MASGVLTVITLFSILGPVLSKVPVTVRARKAGLRSPCLHIQDQRFNDFKNDTMELSVNKAKLTGLCARNSANIQQVLILKSVLGPEKFPGLSRRETVPDPLASRRTIWKLLERIK